MQASKWINEEIPPMKSTLIERQIAACESYIRNFESGLPYADGPAYSQDKEQIRQLRKEVEAWREILAIVKGAA